MEGMPVAADGDDAVRVLGEVFGYPSFRGLQEEVVRHVISGGDALVLMPTGGGKSLCYQIPAIVRPGLGVVVSPLIALMKDQVDALRQAGVRAAFLNSSLSSGGRRLSVERRTSTAAARLDLLYVAPERADDGAVPRHARRRTGLALVRHRRGAVACSPSGADDFRPRPSAGCRCCTTAFPTCPRMALTATADGHEPAPTSSSGSARRPTAHIFAAELRPAQYPLHDPCITKADAKAQLARLPQGQASSATRASSIACRAAASVDERAAP